MVVPVAFVDTTIFCNIIPVPGRDQDHDLVIQDLKSRTNAKQRFILPVTSVIETGNFVAQLVDGNVRRETASRLRKVLSMICEGKAPWVLHDFAWNKEFLTRFLEGADTSIGYIEHAVTRLGAGDLCILTERFTYERRTGIQAEVWTLDHALRAHERC